MSVDIDPACVYAHRRRDRAQTRAGVDRRHWRVGTGRLAGLGLAGLLALGSIGGAPYSAWWILAPLVGVFFLGVWLDRLEAARTRCDRAIAYYDRGIARIEGRWAGDGASGRPFAPADHLSADDLDLFGPGSLFQLLCAARTRAGEATLARWLLTPAPPDVIGARQHAVTELAGKLDLREALAVLGDDIRAGVDHDALRAWAARPAAPPPARWVAVTRGATAAAVVAIGVAVVYGLAAGRTLAVGDGTMTILRWYLVAAFGTTAAISARSIRSAVEVFRRASAAASDIGLLRGLLGRLEVEPFDSARLRDLRAALDCDGVPPSRQVARLTWLVEQVDSRRNAIAALLWFLLALDVHLAHALERWRTTSGPALGRWLDAVGEFEALASLAGFRFERPDHAWPVVSDTFTGFDATAIAHPLLGPDAVPNDVRLTGTRQLLIVSGSNMSGKSTLLRTIGVNLVLAQAGAPVRASRLHLAPLTVGASIRINDSLHDGRSRFYAEVERLHAIVSAAASPDATVIFLIDECLHGTNSHDRRIGADAIVRALLDRRARGLVTTHDLALTELADRYGDRAANVHFVDELVDGRLVFDYRMRSGVVRKSNAVALMRAVGLEV